MRREQKSAAVTAIFSLLTEYCNDESLRPAHHY